MNDLAHVLLVLKELNLENEIVKIQSFGSGLVNNTWLVNLKTNKIIVQRINKNIFKNPEYIDHNLNILANYFSENYPEYIFTKPLSNPFGKTLFYIQNEYYRAYEYINNSYSYNTIEKENLAYEAARQFGKFTSQCTCVDISKIKPTIPNFHHLTLRYQNFEQVLRKTKIEKKKEAKYLIQKIANKNYLVEHYNLIRTKEKLKLRIIHHDTKINNVLFDVNNKAICIIDLDTIMPGYYISDVGDMMRTYLSQADENEIDTTKINIRSEYFKAIAEGYLEQMKNSLIEEELNEFVFSGEFMIYMQAVRFLTDYLEDNKYYATNYPLQNFDRAKNQMVLLEKYEEMIPYFKNFIRNKLYYIL
ncbi:phosphotransferase enzyme family protein [Hydrotalea sp.]|uniref:phosphotransferase enzyme family protein n=1 Tax=Hydrotalea sp. TaxID=2881279 RepID=UPI003D11C223